jgi:iron complex transport system substrate-binding protein
MNMEYLETSPLGRAEWVKLIGCLLDRYDEAEELFAGIEKEYLRLSELARSADYYPVVFSGSKYESKWFTPGNQSFVAQYIRDSGARYAFKHINGKGNVELDFESVLSTLAKADYWGLIVSSHEDFALSNLLKMEPRYALFNSFKEGQIFVCNTAKSDYFGDAVLEPEVVLADLIGVIHPGLLPNHVHTYFHPVVIDVKS